MEWIINHWDSVITLLNSIGLFLVSIQKKAQ